jgi:hypothetical protein
VATVRVASGIPRARAGPSRAGSRGRGSPIWPVGGTGSAPRSSTCFWSSSSGRSCWLSSAPAVPACSSGSG